MSEGWDGQTNRRERCLLCEEHTMHTMRLDQLSGGHGNLEKEFAEAMEILNQVKGGIGAVKLFLGLIGSALMVFAGFVSGHEIRQDSKLEQLRHETTSHISSTEIKFKQVDELSGLLIRALGKRGAAE